MLYSRSLLLHANHLAQSKCVIMYHNFCYICKRTQLLTDVCILVISTLDSLLCCICKYIVEDDNIHVKHITMHHIRTPDSGVRSRGVGYMSATVK